MQKRWRVRKQITVGIWTAIITFLTSLMNGGLDNILKYFRKSPQEQAKEDSHEVHSAHDKAQSSRGDMRDIDRLND